MTAIAALIASSTLTLAAAAGPTKFGVDDLVRVANLTDLDLSPDGESVVYSAGEPEFKSDQPRYDVWRVRWDGSDRKPLTRTNGSRPSARTESASHSCPIAGARTRRRRSG